MLYFIFWFSLFMILYAYFGYPLCLMAILAKRKILGIFSSKKQREFSQATDGSSSSLFEPNVSFIITAYNEENRIDEKLKNSLSQDYPRNKLEIIVASDCSTDKTDEIVKTYKTKGIKLVRAKERKGKENAQKHAVVASNGEILVFSDVATILKPNALTNIVSNFSNPTIGCVSSEDKFIDKDGNISGEGAYVKYEMLLRSLETRVNTLVGLSGSFFAARRVVCEKWETDLQSDFNTLLNSVKIGLRGISDSKSIGYYLNIADEKKEFRRKVRTVLRGISVLMRNLSLFNVGRYGIFSWQLFSHKFCRWLVPFFIIILFIANMSIAFDSTIYFFIFLVQLLCYLSAFYYFIAVQKNKTAKNYQANTLKQQNNNAISKLHKLVISISKILYYFATVNYAIIIAWKNYFKGERTTFWEPSKR